MTSDSREPAKAHSSAEELLRLARSASHFTEEEVLEEAYDETHIKGEMLWDCLENRLDGDARAEVESHLARCPFCFDSYAVLGRLKLDVQLAPATVLKLPMAQMRAQLGNAPDALIANLAASFHELVKEGKRTLDEISQALDSAAHVYCALPEASFTSEEVEPLYLRYEDQGLVIVVQENEDHGTLDVYVQADRKQPRDQLAVWLTGSEGHIEAALGLNQNDEGAWVGHCTLGRTADIVGKVGRRFVVSMFPVDPTDKK